MVPADFQLEVTTNTIRVPGQAAPIKKPLTVKARSSLVSSVVFVGVV